MKGGKHQYLAHHGLIKLIIMDDLGGLQNLVLWDDFVDMDKKTFLETKAQAQLELEGAVAEGVLEKEGAKIKEGGSKEKLKE